MAKKKVKAARVNYLIEVNVDSHGVFTYTSNGQPAKTLQVLNKDTLSWRVYMGGIPVPFTVEFKDLGPAGVNNRVVRSLFSASTPMTVNVPKFYPGNRVLKYTVTLTNGWSDDPDVVPVSSDGVLAESLQNITLSINSGNLVLSPDPAAYQAELEWQWQGDITDDFVLTFTNGTLPQGWPKTTNSKSQKIVLDLPSPGVAQPYRIDLVNYGLYKTGTINP